MGNEVALRRTDVPAVFTEQMFMAKTLAESDLLPKHLRGRPANVLVILQGARALDVAGFWALQSMHVVDGKLGMAAELMRALVIRAGHRFTIIERSMERAVVEIQRSDRDKPYRAEFTYEDAKLAELTGKDNWRKYRKSMLVARATSIAVRDECADVMFGVVYTPDELGAVTDEEGTPLVEATEVEVLTDEEILQAADALAQTDLEDLPRIWLVVAEHGAQEAPIPELDPPDTLGGYLAARLGMEALVCQTKADVRTLWAVAGICKALNMVVTVEGQEQELGALLQELGKTLPDEVPAEPEPVSEHAAQLQAEAAASWGDPPPGLDKARLEADRDKVFDDLRKMREGDG